MMSKVHLTLKLTRQQRLEKIRKKEPWDIIVIGGGITGAGILKLASQCGLKALLVEQQDFAWGSSSRSSKMVHGGLRYIAQGDIKLTLESVRERQRLLNDAPNLVAQQSFVMSHYEKQFPPAWLFNRLLSVYDMFAGKKQHKYWQQLSYRFLVPNSAEHKNNKANQAAAGGTQFVDAMTDDARLVLRLIQEAQQLGAQAINYVKVKQFIYQNKKVIGVTAETTNNLSNEKSQTEQGLLALHAKIIINSTGAWANELLKSSPLLKESPINMRPLRGSHLIVPSWRLPVASVISILHPLDKRPVQVFPWQNVTVIGTTDVEHQQKLSKEPGISQSEFDYLLAAVIQQFPSAKITPNDIISTFAGIRPVVSKKQSLSKSTSTTEIKPSQEKRDHSIFEQAGLITVTGGKLTTFRIIAEQVLLKAAKALKDIKPSLAKKVWQQAAIPIFTLVKLQNNSILSKHIHHKLAGCYGTLTDTLIAQSTSKELTPISYSCSLWAELIWALKYEQVCHLDDLLLRRSRIGNVLTNGGLDFVIEIKMLCQDYLGWSNEYWLLELSRYKKIWAKNYSLPNASNADTNKKKV